ncbi:MAG TPA: DNA-processing protein DprA [Gemmatimonadales bacterium]|nr:DNA-processing protein DprA [Gemmatimonadales bacterium]
MALDERAAWLALALTPGIGSARLDTLLHHFGSASGALSAPFAFLRAVPGISAAAATAITAAADRGVDQVLRSADALGARWLIPTDPEFPAICRLIPDRPTLLFVQGDLTLLERPAVAIVGSRDHTEYGGRIARQLAAGAAARGLAVVSGMARGLDAVAHTAALDVDGATIGVLGNGLGVVYPAANRRLYQRVAASGLLLTEFPPGERPALGSFPRRNRLISALARVTVVVEAAEGSGALITVTSALSQGKDVMAVPGPIDSPTSVGTNRLIRDGAEPLLCIEDLLAHYPEARPLDPAAATRLDARTRAPAAPPDLSPAERRLFDLLLDGNAGADQLLTRSNLPAPEALVALSGLELRGLVAQDGGLVRLLPAAQVDAEGQR